MTSQMAESRFWSPHLKSHCWASARPHPWSRGPCLSPALLLKWGLGDGKPMANTGKMMWLIQNHWTYWRMIKEKNRSKSPVYPGAGCRVWYFKMFSPHLLCYLSSPFVHLVWCLMLGLALHLSAVGWSELNTFFQIICQWQKIIFKCSGEHWRCVL